MDLWSAALSLSTPKTESGDARVSIADRNADAWPSDCLELPTDRLSRENPFPQDERIQFFEEAHIYEVDGKQVETSVTSFVHAPFPHFDADLVLGRMSEARKYERYGTTNHDTIKEQWTASGEAASRLGTKMHAAIEVFFNTHVLSCDPEIAPEMQQFTRFLKREIEARGISAYRTEPTIFAEPDSAISLAGSVDFLGRDRDGKFWIMDWKRSKEIKLSASGRFGKGTEPPFDVLENVNHIHYSLQLHTYRYLFQRFYGLSIPAPNLYMVVFHVDHADYEMYQAKDLSSEVETMFERYPYWLKLILNSNKKHD